MACVTDPDAPLATDAQARAIRFTDARWHSAPGRWAGFAMERHQIGPRGALVDFAVPELLLGLCLAGRAEVQVRSPGRSSTVQLQAQRFILLDRGPQPHDLHWEGQRETLYVRLDAALAGRLLPDLPPARLAVQPQFGGHDAQLSRLLACMAHEAEAGSPCGPAFAESLSLALLLHLLQRHGRHPAPDAESERTFGSLVRERLAEHVRAHLAAKVSLVELAAVAGLSPHYFLQVFRNTFGMTPHRYLLRQRIEHAKQLLAHEQASISDVGLALGFADQSHFTATFRRLAGSTPSQWRRARR